MEILGRNLEFMGKNQVVKVRNVGFVTSDGSWNLTIHNGHIQSITLSNEEQQWLCLPPLADLHLHANRAYTIQDRRPVNFDDAVNMTLHLFKDFSTEAYRRQALRLFKASLSHGTTKMRTHADLDFEIGRRAIEGSLMARDDLKGEMDVEIVAFATSRLDPVESRSLELFENAISLGCSHIGATPVLYPSPEQSLKALMEFASGWDVPVDLHLDEHLVKDKMMSGLLADLTIANGMEGKVTLSHGCAISILEPIERRMVIEKLVRAQITVIALPLTNCYLQDRNSGFPLKRGLTPVKELLDHGVPVFMATDNVRDAFYPYGNGDLIESLFIGMLASQVDDPKELVKFICEGRTKVQKGDTADMVLIPASSFDEILSNRQTARLVIRRGVLKTQIS